MHENAVLVRVFVVGIRIVMLVYSTDILSGVFLMIKDTGDYLRMFLIMDKCDPPGVFRCEALIKAYNIKDHEVPVHGDFDAEETKEGKVASTCMTSIN